MFWDRKKYNKLFIPFSEHNGVGGVDTFLKNLNSYLKQIDYPLAQKVTESSAIFFPITTAIENIQAVKTNKGKVIQRLDGIYYPSQHGPEYEGMNSYIKEIYQNYSDFIVFQSEYSKSQCFNMFGEKPENEYTIIINSVNDSLFYPDTNKLQQVSKKDKRLKFISTGNFRKLVMIEPIVKALDILKEQRYDFEYHIIGKAIPELDQLLDRDYIVNHGQQDLNYIANELRSADVFLHSQLNDNCPNAVLEAVSSGVPVVAFNSGGVKELLHFSLDTLAIVPEKLFNTAEDFDYNEYFKALQKTVENLGALTQRYSEHTKEYALDIMGESYVKVFNQFI